MRPRIYTFMLKGTNDCAIKMCDFYWMYLVKFSNARFIILVTCFDLEKTTKTPYFFHILYYPPQLFQNIPKTPTPRGILVSVETIGWEVKFWRNTYKGALLVFPFGLSIESWYVYDSKFHQGLCKPCTYVMMISLWFQRNLIGLFLFLFAFSRIILTIFTTFINTIIQMSCNFLSSFSCLWCARRHTQLSLIFYVLSARSFAFV